MWNMTRYMLTSEKASKGFLKRCTCIGNLGSSQIKDWFYDYSYMQN